VTTPGAGRPGDEASENFDPSETYREARAHFEADFERRYVAWLLARFDGNLSAAARGARMDRNHLTDLARRHGLDRKRLAGRRVASRWGPGKLLVRREPKARSPHP